MLLLNRRVFGLFGVSIVIILIKQLAHVWFKDTFLIIFLLYISSIVLLPLIVLVFFDVSFLPRRPRPILVI